MSKHRAQIIAGIFILLSAPAGAVEWYSSASFIAAYGEIDGLRSVGAPLGPLNTSGRADEVGGLGLAVGYAGIAGPWRTELEYIWRYRTDMNFNQLLAGDRVNGYKNDIRTQQLMANVYVDFRRGKRITPYVGAGAGLVRHEIETGRSIDLTFPGGHFSAESTEFSWTAMAGVVLDDFYRGKLQVGYRFNQLGETKTNRFPDGSRFEARDYRSHDIVVAWRLPL